jgi:hypothetical protein
MQTRGISEEEVRLVLDDPDATYPSGTSDRFCYVRDIGGRRIKVVVESFDHEQVVTTYDQLDTTT